MLLLEKACRRVWKRLSGRSRPCKNTKCSRLMREETLLTVSATAASSLPGTRADSSSALLEASSHSDGATIVYCHPGHRVVNVTTDLQPQQPRSNGGAGAEEMLALSGAFAVGPAEVTKARTSWTAASWESDSGVCLAECEEDVEEEEEVEEVEEVEEDDEEEEWYDECDCDECSFARTEDSLQDWHVSAKDLTLDKVVSSRQEERVYSGYWHGSVTVHQRQSPLQSNLNFYIREAHILSKIRHENVQLFLGVCLDLKPDSVALVMSNIKGESLHSLLHGKGQELQFSAMTKYLNQIAQGMAYLHDRGISHPLLTSKSISIHYRVCISMLSPSFCSNTVEPSQLVYIPPEIIQTLTPSSSSGSLTTHPANQDSSEANIFSFGTIVYEMVTNSRPFRSVPGELIIWEVGNGHCQSLNHMNNGKLKDIVRRCWAPNSQRRPSFKELLSTLEHNMSPRACGLNAYFSFSDPGRLAHTGLH